MESVVVINNDRAARLLPRKLRRLHIETRSQASLYQMGSLLVKWPLPPTAAIFVLTVNLCAVEQSKDGLA